jgi:hypothetical protein
VLFTGVNTEPIPYAARNLRHLRRRAKHLAYAQLLQRLAAATGSDIRAERDKARQRRAVATPADHRTLRGLPVIEMPSDHQRSLVVCAFAPRPG